jgi:4-hydroxy-tetrahydrodipicolinate reductase
MGRTTPRRSCSVVRRSCSEIGRGALRGRPPSCLKPRSSITASSTKPDVPSGTARELAERLGETRTPTKDRALDETAGPIEARGATVDGVQVHSLRLPSFSVSTEVIFGLPHERLTIRHDADSSPDPYVEGTLLAVRRVMGRVGLTRGLDSLLI